MPQSLLASGIPAARAGIDSLLRFLTVVGNVTGAAALADITVPGYTHDNPILFVQDGDGTNLAAADVTLGSVEGTIRLSVSTVADALNVAFFDLSRATAMIEPGTEKDAIAGIVSDLLSTKLRLSTVAGNNGALTLTGLAVADNVLAMWVDDGSVDMSGSVFTVTANTLTGAPVVDTSGTFVHILWLDESQTVAGDRLDWNTDLAQDPGIALNQLVRGLRLTQVAGPAAVGATAVVTGMVATDNLLGIGNSDLTPTVDGSLAWTVGSGVITRANTDDALDGNTLSILWLDVSAIGV